MLIWLAIMQSVRVAKLGVSTVALARGETRSPMAANVLRVLLLPAAWIAVGQGAGVLAVVWIATLGELLGLGVAFWLLDRWHRVPIRGLVWPFALWGAVLLLIGLTVSLRPPEPAAFANFGWPQNPDPGRGRGRHARHGGSAPLADPPPRGPMSGVYRIVSMFRSISGAAEGWRCHCGGRVISAHECCASRRPEMGADQSRRPDR